MANELDKCEGYPVNSTNENACASARLIQDTHCARPPQDVPPPPQDAPAPVLLAPAHMPDHKFHGLNLGLFKIGCRDHSFALGVNIGIAKTDVQLGQETRVDAGVNLGPIGARGGVGVGINGAGLHSDVGGRFHAVKLVDTGAEFKANLGPRSSVHADTGAKVLFAHTRHTFNSSVGEDGFNNGYNGEVGLAKAVGVQAGGHANLNNDSSFGGDARTTLGKASLGAGADLNSNGNTVINPDVHVAADSGQEAARWDVGAQVGPKLDVRAGTVYNTTDRYNDYQTGSASIGVGQSGIGAQTMSDNNGQKIINKAGWGPDYMSDF